MATQILRRGKNVFYPKKPAYLALPKLAAACIWRRGKHNAFTDLVFFRGQLFCVFREADAHVSNGGRLRILASRNGSRWRSVALINSDSADLRDGKLVATPDGRLQLIGVGALHDRSAYSHQSYVWFSVDGYNWGEAIAVGEPNIWIWRLTWHQGSAYAIGYKCGQPRFVRLYKSDDGIHFAVWVQTLQQQGYPNESALLFLADDTAVCLLRRDPDPGLLGIAKPPYFDWQWQNLSQRIGGPQALVLPDGRLLATVRLYQPTVRTSLCLVDLQSGAVTETHQLPSAGDTSYAGMCWRAGKLQISYYSSHQGKTAIYFSQIALADLLI